MPRPLKKKPKRQATSTTPAVSYEDAQDNTLCYLLRLPLELLVEILSYTRPPALLSLARTSKYFCGILCDPGSSFIWKRARIDPDFLFAIPDPLPNMPEPAYAAMIFDPGKCYICEKRTDRMFHSYAYQVRLCSKRVCKERWDDDLSFIGVDFLGFIRGHGKFTTIADQTEFLKTVFEESDDSLVHTLALCGAVHLVPLETSGDEPSSPTAIYLREQLQSAMRAFAKKYFPTKGNPQAFDALISTYTRQKEIQDQRHQHFMELQSWSKKHEELKEQITIEHLQHFQSFAMDYCLQMADMKKSVTFLHVQKLCLRLFDEPISQVMEPYEDRIIEETGVLSEARERRAHEQRVSARRDDIKNYYKEYDAPILPNLDVFRRLPILHALQRRDAPRSLQEDLQSDAIATTVQDQLEQWVKRAKDDVMKLFGYGRGKGQKEYRPQVSKVHPLERPTALFQCKECNRVGGSSGRMGVLDFKALCLHQCIQPSRSKPDRTRWSASNFELALGAIATAHAAMNALDRDEDTTRLTDLGSKWFRCKMCAHGVREMVFEDLLRHCQRHTTQSVSHAGDHDHQPQHQEPAKRLRSVAELRSGMHNREVVRHQFACAHCRFHNTQTKAGAEPTWVEVKAPKRMDFNGLRSHLATRHQVHDVRNEDYYWLPWDKSMEPAEKAKKPVTPPPPTAPEPEPEPMEEDVIPDLAYQLQKRRIRVKRHFCLHCPEGSISHSARRGFDWQGLTAHMKSKHSIDGMPADTIDYDMRDQDRSAYGILRPVHRDI